MSVGSGKKVNVLPVGDGVGEGLATGLVMASQRDSLLVSPSGLVSTTVRLSVSTRVTIHFLNGADERVPHSRRASRRHLESRQLRTAPPAPRRRLATGVVAHTRGRHLAQPFVLIRSRRHRHGAFPMVGCSTT